MTTISEGPITVKELLLIQEYAKSSDLQVAITLLAGRTGLTQEQIGQLDAVSYFRLLDKVAEVLKGLHEQQCAVLAAEAMMQPPIEEV